MTFGKRLRALRNKKDITQADLAKVLGLGESTISFYESNKREPDREKLLAIASYFNITTDELLGRDIPTLLPESFPLPIEKIPIPILGTAPCGPSDTAIQEILGYMYIDNRTAMQGEHFGLYARGDSMIPTISPGDRVVIRKQSTVDNGQVAVILIDKEETCIKRVFCDEGNCILQSDNQAYPPRNVKQEDVLILGRVIEVRKTM